MDADALARSEVAMNPRTPAIATYRFPVHGEVGGVHRYDLRLAIQIAPPTDDHPIGALDVLLIDDRHNLHSGARVSELTLANTLRRLQGALTRCAPSDHSEHLPAVRDAVRRILTTE